MNKVTAFLFLLISVSSLLSCRKEKEKVDFTITFKALYDGQPLVKYKNYAYGDKTINFSRFSTYLSDIGVYDGTESFGVTDIEYIDFTADGAPKDQPLIITKSYRAVPANYKGIQTGFGVSSGLNSKKPSDFSPTHPLYLENEYWIGWKSYIFTKIEGNYDADGDGTPETPLTYHCGSDQVYYTANLLHDFTVEANGNVTIEFDLKKLFTFDGALMDLNVAANRNTSHAANEVALGKKMIANLDDASVVR